MNKLASELERIAWELSEFPSLSMTLTRLAADILAWHPRGPVRTRWHKNNPTERRKRKRWLRSPAGRRYQRRHQMNEKRPAVKNYRRRLRKRGPHRNYPWLH